jgi:hypothetical protein
MGLCSHLGVSLNMKKRQRCGQSVEYSGFLFDTFRGRLLVLSDKVESLVEQATALSDTAATWSARELDSAVGRLRHYSAAVPHLRVFVTEIARLAGRVDESLYDFRRAVHPELPALAGEVSGLIRRFAPQGCPLWPPVPSSSYAALLSGEAPDVFCSLTWDASTGGWAALARWWECGVPRRQLFIGTWPAGWDVSAQPFREALGGALAFESFVSAVDVRGRFCILRNDASAAISAFRKGSTVSPQMQRAALHIARVAASVDVPLLPWHVPGLTLVAEGIDGASRSGSVRCLRLRPA